MRQQLMAVGVALVVMLALAPSGDAAETVPIDFYEISCQIDPGMQWMSSNGRKMHMRGGVSQSIFYDAETFEVTGHDTIVVNTTVRTRSGNMKICGTFSLLYLPLSRTATFDGTWRASATVLGFTGRAVGKGTYGLEGSKMRLDLVPLTPDQMPAEIQQLLAESPWTECENLAGVLRATGTVRVKTTE